MTISIREESSPCPKPSDTGKQRLPAPTALGWHRSRMYITPFPANAHLTHHLHCDSRSDAGLGGD